MTAIRVIRLVAWAAVFVVAAGAAFLWFMGPQNRASLGDTIASAARVGGPFELVRDDGAPVTDKDLLGKPHAIFFGFTHCPEVCPTTLYEASGWLEALGPDADKFAVWFVTVDPERDTPAVLKDYVASFHKNIRGITGDPEKVARTLADYRVFSRKVPLDGGDYTMDHTATVFLFDGAGEFKGTIAWGESADTAVEKIRRLVKNG